MPRCGQCRFRIRSRGHEDGTHHGGGLVPAGKKRSKGMGMRDQNKLMADNPVHGSTGHQESRKAKK